MKRDYKLWYDQPSTLADLSEEQCWNRGLPIGNGRLGGMVFGDIGVERIQLNEESIWAGPPVPTNREGAWKAIERARELLFAGELVKAERLVQEEVLHPHTSPRSYQPFGDIRLYDEAVQYEEIESYRRELDLETAVATVTYSHAGVQFLREYFSSKVDQVLVARWTTDGAEGIHARIELARDYGAAVQATDSGRLVLTGQAGHDGTHSGVKFAGLLQIVAEGENAQVSVSGQCLCVSGADSLSVFAAIRTDYQFSQPSVPMPHDLVKQCEADIERVMGKSYERIKEEHIADYRQLFQRVSLRLGGERDSSTDAEACPTDLRLKRFSQDRSDLGLFELYFQYGRYLLISSSRPECMPANLQGVWNPWLKAPWDSDYHININIQMNYWPAQITNLAECHLPYFHLIEGLLDHGRKTADEVYGCGGFTAHYTTDAWLYTAPLGLVVYGMWPMAAGWCTRDFLEYYRFTGDTRFLQERAYPILKEAGTFFLDWLVCHPKTGKWVSGPSISPENKYITADGQQASLCMGPAMDHQIIGDTFSNILETARELGIEDDFTKRVREVWSELDPPKIGKDGRLLEWNEEYDEAEPGHRHISHLYAVHPGTQFTFSQTPELMAAARKSLEYRLSHGGGHTGWSRAWIINFWARFKDGEQAYGNLIELLAQSTLPNLFDNHPPFQIDGNFGGTAGIAEMLLQSHEKNIELLPALPSAWNTGSVYGLRARGGFEADIAWENGRLKSCRLKSVLGKNCLIHYQQYEVSFPTEKGFTYVMDESLSIVEVILIE